MTNTSANAAQRVPVLGETQTALVTSEFTGRLLVSQHAGHAAQADFEAALTFQAAYTFSKSENNLTVLNDQNNLALDKARAAFDRTHRADREFRLPVAVTGGNGLAALTQGWSLTGSCWCRAACR